MAQLKRRHGGWLLHTSETTEKPKRELRTSNWVLPADVAKVSFALLSFYPTSAASTLPPIGREWCAAAPPLAPTPPRALTSAAFGAGGGFVQRAVGSGRLGAADG